MENKNSDSVLKNVTWVTVIMLLSKVLGFLRQAMIAFSFGSDYQTDIYFTSSDFMLGLSFAFTEALTMGLVTVYIQTRTQSGVKAANTVARKVMTMYLLFSVVLVGMLVLCAPLLAKILCPGYTGAQSALLIRYLRLFSLTILFAAFQSNLAAVLNANDSYIPGKLYGVIVNPVIILFMMLLGAKIGLYALVIGFVLANLIQIGLLAACCRRIFRFRPASPFHDAKVKNILKLSVPLLLSNLLVQCNHIIDKIICSLLGEGTVSSYAYANTLEQFVTASFTVSVGLILFSKFSEYVAQNNQKEMTKTLTRSVTMVLWILIPVSLVAVFSAGDIVKIIYQRGSFTAADTQRTAVALIGLCAGIPASAVRELYLRAHYSHQNTKTPLILSLFGVVLNAVLSVALSFVIGILGIALSTSVSVVFTVVLLNRSIRHYLPEYRFFAVRGEYIRFFLAALAACVPLTLLTVLPLPGGLWMFLEKCILGFSTYEGALLLTASKSNRAGIRMLKKFVRSKLHGKERQQL